MAVSGKFIYSSKDKSFVFFTAFIFDFFFFTFFSDFNPTCATFACFFGGSIVLSSGFLTLSVDSVFESPISPDFSSRDFF